jgi:2-phospho-L-lactate guanylyltransferase
MTWTRDRMIVDAAPDALRRGTLALVPARSFRSGKSRLDGRLGDDRPRVARALFDRVVGVLAGSRAITGILVATDGADVAAAAAQHGADVLFDPTDCPERAQRVEGHGPYSLDTALAGARSGSGQSGGAGLAGIIDRGLAQLAARGARAALVVMADLPMFVPGDVEQMCRALVTADLVLAPDRELMGTNALAVRLPAPIATRFGNRDSFPRHLTASGELRLAVVHSPGLAFDLDQPADLDELERRRRGTTSRENVQRASRVSSA